MSAPTVMFASHQPEGRWYSSAINNLALCLLGAVWQREFGLFLMKGIVR